MSRDLEINYEDRYFIDRLREFLGFGPLYENIGKPRSSDTSYIETNVLLNKYISRKLIISITRR